MLGSSGFVRAAPVCFVVRERSPERSSVKQSPIRKLRRDRARLVQDLALARGTNDPKASEIETRMSELDKEIATMEAENARKRGG